jgi:paraquat-inducible protein A
MSPLVLWLHLIAWGWNSGRYHDTGHAGCILKSLREENPGRVDIYLSILGAAILLAFGIYLPLLRVTQLIFLESNYSIVSGIEELFRDGEYFLGILILLFSVVFPVGKIVALTIIWTARLTNTERMRALDWLGHLGKWSMLEVLIVALMILSFKLKVLAHAETRYGIYIFSLSVILSKIVVVRVERLARVAGRSD